MTDMIQYYRTPHPPGALHCTRAAPPRPAPPRAGAAAGAEQGRAESVERSGDAGVWRLACGAWRVARALCGAVRRGVLARHAWLGWRWGEGRPTPAHPGPRPARLSALGCLAFILVAGDFLIASALALNDVQSPPKDQKNPPEPTRHSALEGVPIIKNDNVAKKTRALYTKIFFVTLQTFFCKFSL